MRRGVAGISKLTGEIGMSGRLLNRTGLIQVSDRFTGRRRVATSQQPHAVKLRLLGLTWSTPQEKGQNATAFATVLSLTPSARAIDLSLIPSSRRCLAFAAIS